MFRGMIFKDFVVIFIVSAVVIGLIIFACIGIKNGISKAQNPLKTESSYLNTM